MTAPVNQDVKDLPEQAVTEVFSASAMSTPTGDLAKAVTYSANTIDQLMIRVTPVLYTIVGPGAVSQLPK